MHMFLNILYFIDYSAHLKNGDEILPAHYTWKVVEKGLKIKWIKINLRKIIGLKHS